MACDDIGNHSKRRWIMVAKKLSVVYDKACCPSSAVW